MERPEVWQVGGEWPGGVRVVTRGEEAQLGGDEAEEGAECGVARKGRRRGEAVVKRAALRPRELQLGVAGGGGRLGHCRRSALLHEAGAGQIRGEEPGVGRGVPAQLWGSPWT